MKFVDPSHLDHLVKHVNFVLFLKFQSCFYQLGVQALSFYLNSCLVYCHLQAKRKRGRTPTPGRYQGERGGTYIVLKFM